MSEDPQVSDEMAGQMRASFFEATIEDFELKSEAWRLVIAPVGDSVGFRAEVHTAGDEGFFMAGATNASALTAGSMAIARAIVAIEEAIAESRREDEEDAMDNREQ